MLFMTSRRLPSRNPISRFGARAMRRKPRHLGQIFNVEAKVNASLARMLGQVAADMLSEVE